MFDVGQKIICVDDCFPEAVLLYFRNLPKKGTVYTVRDVIPAQGWKGEGACAILLREVANPSPPHRKQWGECGFAPERFRELESGFDSNFAEESLTVHINCRCTIEVENKGDEINIILK